MNELISIVGFFFSLLYFKKRKNFGSQGIPREWLTSFPAIVGLNLKSLRVGSTFKSSQLCILFHFRCRPRIQGEGRYLGCGLFFLHLQKDPSKCSPCTAATCLSISALIGRFCGGCVWNLLPRSCSTSPKWPRLIRLQGEPCRAVSRHRYSGMDHWNQH